MLLKQCNYPCSHKNSSINSCLRFQKSRFSKNALEGSTKSEKNDTTKEKKCLQSTILNESYLVGCRVVRKLNDDAFGIVLKFVKVTKGQVKKN